MQRLEPANVRVCVCVCVSGLESVCVREKYSVIESTLFLELPCEIQSNCI